MSNVSKCFSCTHKNDYDPKFGYYGCNLSGQECKGYSMFEPKAKLKPTNADRIRAMSDEELAEWFFSGDYPWCVYEEDVVPCTYEDIPVHPCERCLLNWLKQEEDT